MPWYDDDDDVDDDTDCTHAQSKGHATHVNGKAEVRFVGTIFKITFV